MEVYFCQYGSKRLKWDDHVKVQAIAHGTSGCFLNMQKWGSPVRKNLKVVLHDLLHKDSWHIHFRPDKKGNFPSLAEFARWAHEVHVAGGYKNYCLTGDQTPPYGAEDLCNCHVTGHYAAEDLEAMQQLEPSSFQSETPSSTTTSPGKPSHSSEKRMMLKQRLLTPPTKDTQDTKPHLTSAHAKALFNDDDIQQAIMNKMPPELGAQLSSFLKSTGSTDVKGARQAKQPFMCRYYFLPGGVSKCPYPVGKCTAYHDIEVAAGHDEFRQKLCRLGNACLHHEFDSCLFLHEDPPGERILPIYDHGVVSNIRPMDTPEGTVSSERVEEKRWMKRDGDSGGDSKRDRERDRDEKRERGWGSTEESEKEIEEKRTARNGENRREGTSDRDRATKRDSDRKRERWRENIVMRDEEKGDEGTKRAGGDRREGERVSDRERKRNQERERSWRTAEDRDNEREGNSAVRRRRPQQWDRESETSDSESDSERTWRRNKARERPTKGDREGGRQDYQRERKRESEKQREERKRSARKKARQNDREWERTMNERESDGETENTRERVERKEREREGGNQRRGDEEREARGERENWRTVTYYDRGDTDEYHNYYDVERNDSYGENSYHDWEENHTYYDGYEPAKAQHTSNFEESHVYQQTHSGQPYYQGLTRRRQPQTSNPKSVMNRTPYDRQTRLTHSPLLFRQPRTPATHYGREPLSPSTPPPDNSPANSHDEPFSHEDDESYQRESSLLEGGKPTK
eukprot:Lithocolla_globosa_v1_NODE_46_length_7973_cov_21.867264.p2 type:complete len:747 gc:universal NODE_46_length_7973_cov_21.867264:2287-4527(+)